MKLIECYIVKQYKLFYNFSLSLVRILACKLPLQAFVFFYVKEMKYVFMINIKRGNLLLLGFTFSPDFDKILLTIWGARAF